MDNASNNNTLMVEIEGKLRCFPHAMIQEGNENGYWRGKLPDGKSTLPTLQLLHNCTTRWSSMFNMVDCVLMLNPAIQSFLLETQNADISDLSMDVKDIDVLQDIHQVIKVPHVAHQLLSSEQTPTLSMALPAYKVLTRQWTQLQSTIWELSHYIEVGLDKLNQYINEGRKTCIYALSMVVNPNIKLKCQAQQELSMPSTSQCELTNSTAISSQSLSAGYGCMNKLNITVQHSASIPTTSSTPPTPTIIVSEPTMAPETVQEHIHKELKQDRKDAECKFSHYEDAGLLPDMAKHTTDIVHFWEQKEHTFPLLFCVPMDVLPAQASSVPSDNLSPAILEALQVLKFTYKQDCLNFTEDLVANEQDYMISGPVTSRAVDELMAAGNLCKLDQLLANAREIYCN
ncbi:hypothetical protein BDR05DRAFT_976640 [Suillus weaverae]|nr:hypothetical protein BDR05DRAFT_976640 [Suillus weaverae]